MTNINKTILLILTLLSVTVATFTYSMDFYVAARAFFVAARKGDNEKIKKMIAADPDFIHLVDQHDGTTPLHDAAFYGACGAKDVVQTLVKAGSKVDKQDYSGQTALHKSAREDNVDVAVTLLDCGAAINLQDRSGRTALLVACQHEQGAVAQTLIVKGANVNLHDYLGKTPFQEVACHGDQKTAQMLIAAGANIHEYDFYGTTPLRLATVHNHKEIIDLIHTVEKPLSNANKQLFALLCAGHSRLGIKSHAKLIVSDSQGEVAMIIHRFLRQAALENIGQSSCTIL